MQDNAIREFVDSIKEKPIETNRKCSAIVSRVDGEGTVWVHLAGSEKETPTASTSSEVKSGDEVTVEWRNNKLYIAGNYSNPSAGMIRVANVEAAANMAREAANNAVADAGRARSAAEQAEATAAGVEDIAVQARTAATQAQNSLKSVVQGATTVEKAVSVMQTALEAVVDYDPQNDTVQEYFWHDANGAHVLGDTSGYRNDIDSTGMDIVEVASERSVAQFGANGSRIGKEYIQGMSDNESYMTLDYHSMQMQDINGNIFLHISDLRNHDGYATVEELFTGDGNTTVFYLELAPKVSPHHYIKVTIDDVEVSNYTEGGGAITFSTAPSDGAEIKVTFNTSDNRAKAYTVGDRATDSKIGPMSFAEGYDVTASSSYSHAEGVTTTADGQASHAEGAHCVALGACSHAEGSETEARTENSHAQNNNTIASRRDQTVIGRYNIIDTHPNNSDDCYALIIGNGYHQNRSNAFTVDWNGNVEASGDVTDGNGNVLSNKIELADVPVYVDTKSNMTYANVTQALADGKSVFMFDGEIMYAYSSHDTTNDYYWFSRVYGHSGFQRWRIDSSDVWTDEGITNFADYVIAQGTSGIWRYRKWNSGVYECFGTQTASIAVTTASTSYGGYRSGAISIPTFPITFAATPTVTATVGSGSQGCWVNNVQPTTTGGSYYLSSGASSSATNRNIQFQVMGRWK